MSDSALCWHLLVILASPHAQGKSDQRWSHLSAPCPAWGLKELLGNLHTWDVLHSHLEEPGQPLQRRGMKEHTEHHVHPGDQATPGSSLGL